MTDQMTQAAVGGAASDGLSKERLAVMANMAVVVLGGLFLLMNVSYASVWFEEAYSMAMAQHSFFEIWTISAGDVHPALYYCLLHIVYLATGGGAIPFRVFSVLGSIALSLLGLTHVRKDFGDKTGIMFSALAYFLPWSVYAAFQIRMYSWLAVAMTVVVMYAWRIVNACAAGRDAKDAPSVPLHWWLSLFAASVAAAYLHYYGAIAALVANVFLIVYIVKSKAPAEFLRAWAAGAIASVVLLVPFALLAIAQVGSADANAFWSHFDYAKSSSKVFLFPFDSPEVGNYTAIAISSVTGAAPDDALLKKNFNTTVCIISLTMAASCAGIASAFSFGMNEGGLRASEGSSSPDVLERPMTLPVVVIACVCAVSAGLSTLLYGEVLFFRYTAGLIGPVALVMAYAFAHTRKAWLGVVACLLSIACGCAGLVSLNALSHSDHAGETKELYESMTAEARALNDGKDPLVLCTSVPMGSMVTVFDSEHDVHYVSECNKPQAEAFAPQFIIENDARGLIDAHRGAALVIGPLDDAVALAEAHNGRVVEYHNALDIYANVYSNGWSDYSIVVFDDPRLAEASQEEPAQAEAEQEEDGLEE